ncbi:MAG: polysaccharide biosynthesis/export family protein [Nitrospirota bacterium]
MLYRIILGIFLLFFFLGCASQEYAVKTPPTIDLAAKKKTEELNQVIMVNATGATRVTDDYRVGTEDLLEIEAYNVEDLKKTVRVNSQGDIALPLVGIIRVKGLTTSGIEKLITEKLDRYVQETVVNVFIKEYRSQRISVVGAVNSPQVYAVTGQRYLIDMLMTAGGLKEEAGSICYVIRPSDTGSGRNRTETLVVDLNELLVKGNFDLNVPVFAGDVINVPKGGVVFVDGSVRNPGVFTMKGRTTLIQALTMAQGLNPEARESDIRIFRDNGKGERDVIKVDYEGIRSGKNPDVLLADNDVIIVPASGAKNFFNGFISTIKGFISFGKGI